MSKRIHIAIGLAALLPITGVQAISVTPTTNATTLTNAIGGSGITISNPTYSGGSVSAGTFTGAGGAIGINSGIILSTGNVLGAVGPNNSDNTQTDTNGGSHSVLGGTDMASLKFDFTTTGGDIFFNYVFASEEYNEYTNSQFNDKFAFFLDGVNIALIPGTSTEVSINTVNGGNPLGTGASNPSLFNNNDLQDGGPFFDIEYDGFTDVFTAQALNLTPGSHTIELVIVDIGDAGWDSAVFIQAGSFSGTQTPVPDGGWSLALLGISLGGLRFMKGRFRNKTAA